jgi:hypothetical protein
MGLGRAAGEAMTKKREQIKNSVEFEKLWEAVIEAHQDNRLSIGDAYRLKQLLQEKWRVKR